MENYTFIYNANQILTMSGNSNKPVQGKDMSNLNIIQNGGILIKDDTIIMVGKKEEIIESYKDIIQTANHIDASGKIITPGLIDSHTHLVHGGSREDDFEMRLDGNSREEIILSGGGVHSTVQATREMSSEKLYKKAKRRLDQFLEQGVTTIEAKSGYGLNLMDEIKLLEVANSLNKNHPIDIISTFLGAHGVPVEKETDDYIESLITEIIPEISKRNLATFNDVACKRGIFNVKQSRKILEAGKNYGLIPKIHADEEESYGGAELAAEVNAVTADHLFKPSQKGISDMKSSGVIAVLLPGTGMFLKKKPANARYLIDNGLSVALATDFNPGTSPTVSLPLIMNLGCFLMNMTPEEVLTSTTINAAHAIGQSKNIGSIESGKKADLTIFSVPNYLFLTYEYGINHVDKVFKSGIQVVNNGMVPKS